MNRDAFVDLHMMLRQKHHENEPRKYRDPAVTDQQVRDLLRERMNNKESRKTVLRDMSITGENRVRELHRIMSGWSLTRRLPWLKLIDMLEDLRIENEAYLSVTPKNERDTHAWDPIREIIENAKVMLVQARANPEINYDFEYRTITDSSNTSFECAVLGDGSVHLSSGTHIEGIAPFITLNLEELERIVVEARKAKATSHKPPPPRRSSWDRVKDTEDDHDL